MKKEIVTLFTALILSACSSTTYVYNTPSETEPVTTTDSSDDDEGSVPTTFYQALDRCEQFAGQGSKSFGCAYNKVGDADVMALVFKDDAHLDALEADVAEYIAAPFCVYANNQSKAAFVLETIQVSDLIRVFDCKDSSWSEWMTRDTFSKIMKEEVKNEVDL